MNFPVQRHNHRNQLPTSGSDLTTSADPIFLKDGAMLLLRPIHVEDVDALIRAFNRMTPAQVRARVFHALNELPEPVARSMCRVDPDETVALVATDPDGAEIRGEARVHFDPVTESAELALAIDPEYTGRGLGRILVEHLIAACRKRDIREIWGDTQADNVAMLALTRRLGFSLRREHDEASLVHFRLDLRTSDTDETASKG
ncbi:MAG TPA: GNAT family N-acetyltransferase [Dokdonella sp.]|uniref:GNAT family N-acetyltransferase n=1 Tax=Dokdonella sp. TaxID=2291710 RepID=UPI002D7ED053|nr:GNAT family N-acetyltransferase [Dokdonella sp.]HET9033684.1 GNAT family N-acetyltransferase [Dokdonella sp.]